MITTTFGGSPQVAILVKQNAFAQTRNIEKYYINKLVDLGIDLSDIMVVPLSYDKKKVTVKYAKMWLADVREYLPDSCKTLLVTDGEYFKVITDAKKADPYHGYVEPCTLEGFEDFNAVLSINFHALVYNPDLQGKLDRSLEVVADHLKNNYVAPGTDIIHEEHYPQSVEAIAKWLDKLHQYPRLSCDIEAFSLKFYDAGIGTISFAWDEHCGIAFPVDLQTFAHDASSVRWLLKQFFQTYKGELIYHNSGYDVKVLVYQLFMTNLADYKNMLGGVHLMSERIHDTKFIAYLATNRCGQQSFSLKDLAQPYAGNWAQDDIKDITQIPMDKLLRYNLVDSLSTWWVYKKYTPIMLDEGQEDLYYNTFLPSAKVLLQTELVGMPIDPVKVQEAKKTLQGIVDGHAAFIHNNATIQSFQREQWDVMATKDNADRLEKSVTKKVKIKTWEDFKDVPFNPNSHPQIRDLLYEYMGFEAVDFTDTGLPATGAETLEKIQNQAKTADDKAIFDNLIGLSKAMKVLTSFIPAFEQAQRLPDGSYRLYGNFNLGGTQSGRLSSSDPNLQNIPSGSKYAKIIKSCFISGHNWLFGGADFNALEAVTEALLSGDPNKQAVYIDGYDSHCFNTYHYFGDQMPDITFDVASINSIKKKYPVLRQKSKAPTFALQYQGTWFTIMKSAGCSKEEAKAIEQRYLKTYEVSLKWLNDLLDKAHDDGYITGCFGLKIRTPLLKSALKSKYKMPKAVSAERRSAGNAKTQSYGMLNSRATNEFMARVWASEYRYKILPCAQIHDASYFTWADDPWVTTWVNKNLIECMEWQQLPELHHDKIKLGAELDIYWPDWKNPLTLKNGYSISDIRAAADEHKKKIYAKAA